MDCGIDGIRGGGYRAVNPIRPVAPYLGGKRNLAKTLIRRIEQIEHTTYVEPFAGMGGVFLKRRFAAKCEAFNDWGREIANFFRILQAHYIPFMDRMRFKITSRHAFDRLAKTPPESLTDLQRAARFNITRLLDDLHDRLSGVVIECLPYGDAIKLTEMQSSAMTGRTRSSIWIRHTGVMRMTMGKSCSAVMILRHWRMFSALYQPLHYVS